MKPAFHQIKNICWDYRCLYKSIEHRVFAREQLSSFPVQYVVPIPFLLFFSAIAAILKFWVSKRSERRSERVATVKTMLQRNFISSAGKCKLMRWAFGVMHACRYDDTDVNSSSSSLLRYSAGWFRFSCTQTSYLLEQRLPPLPVMEHGGLFIIKDVLLLFVIFLFTSFLRSELWSVRFFRRWTFWHQDVLLSRARLQQLRGYTDIFPCNVLPQKPSHAVPSITCARICRFSTYQRLCLSRIQGREKFILVSDYPVLTAFRLILRSSFPVFETIIVQMRTAEKVCHDRMLVVGVWDLDAFKNTTCSKAESVWWYKKHLSAPLEPLLCRYKI